MKTLTLSQRNDALNTLTHRIEKAKQSKENGMNETLRYIQKQIEELKIETGLSYKKSLNAVQNKILEDLMTVKTTANGRERLVYNGTKEVKRTFNIAFRMLFRKMQIKCELLTVAQIENLVSYGTVKGVNVLYGVDDDAAYIEQVTEYLKSLKTREVTVKTFEKKIKL